MLRIRRPRPDRDGEVGGHRKAADREPGGPRYALDSSTYRLQN